MNYSSHSLVRDSTLESNINIKVLENILFHDIRDWREVI